MAGADQSPPYEHSGRPHRSRQADRRPPDRDAHHAGLAGQAGGDPARTRRLAGPAGDAAGGDPHRRVMERLGWSDNQYTPSRRALVEFLYRSARPVGIDEILRAADLPQSSVYRNLAVLEAAGAVTRFPVPVGHARYELSGAIVGHHHHLVCTGCGRIEDWDLPPALEGDASALLASLAAGRRFWPDSHRLEIFGLGACCA